jgi:hypothetical protein
MFLFIVKYTNDIEFTLKKKKHVRDAQLCGQKRNVKYPASERISKFEHPASLINEAKH